MLHSPARDTRFRTVRSVDRVRAGVQGRGTPWKELEEQEEPSTGLRWGSAKRGSILQEETVSGVGRCDGTVALF